MAMQVEGGRKVGLGLLELGKPLDDCEAKINALVPQPR